jgi:putative photosynthetic complex assembly protein 2
MTDALANPWIAAAIALMLWWLSTGLILWRVRVADNAGGMAHQRSVILGAPLLALGALALVTTRDDPSTAGVYGAFVGALAVWGWIELAFLSGVITGPHRYVCPPRTPGFERFIRAFGTIAWHEGLLAMTTVALGLWLAHAANPFAFLTFATLFLARVSAKLNLFFGVPRINLEFIPRPLRHLTSHFRVAPMTFMFPVSVTALSVATALWADRAGLASAGDGHATGYALLAALTALALLEHWFMVLPVPDQKLWRWMIPAPHTSQTKDPTHGL